MAKTVKEHEDEFADVQKLLKDSEALRRRATEELKLVRATLEQLEKYQHPLLSMRIPPHLVNSREGYSSETNPIDVIGRQIRKINELLGDRP